MKYYKYEIIKRQHINECSSCFWCPSHFPFFNHSPLTGQCVHLQLLWVLPASSSRPPFSRDLPSVHGSPQTWEIMSPPISIDRPHSMAVYSQYMTQIGVPKSSPLASKWDEFCGQSCFRAPMDQAQVASSWEHILAELLPLPNPASLSYLILRALSQ